MWAAASVQRQHSYPSIVYITKSNPSRAISYLEVGLLIFLSFISFLQNFVLLIFTGKLMRKLHSVPVQCTWWGDDTRKHLVSYILHRLQRQQTYPTCSLDVKIAAPAAWPNLPQPAEVYEDCLISNAYHLRLSCFQTWFNKHIKVLQARFEELKAQRQQVHLSLLYLVKLKQLGNPLLGVRLKGENKRICPFPL